MKIFKKIILVLLLFFTSSCNLFSNVPEFEDNRPTYEISNSNFTFKDFHLSGMHNSNTNETRYVVIVVGICKYSLISVNVDVVAYDINNKMVDSFSGVSNQKTSKMTEFSVGCDVSKSVFDVVEFLEVTFTGKSYEKPYQKFTVTFVSNNNESDFLTYVEEGERVERPINPSKENYIFDCWCTDKSLIYEYDFSSPVYNDLILYAKYNLDYETITNKLTTQIMKCNVTVHTKSYNTFLGITTKSESKSGSGIIFYEKNSKYYCFTNTHVAKKESNYDKVSHTIEDYKGNVYEATLQSYDAKYDLAIVYFKKTTNLGVIELGQEDVKSGDKIIAISQPKGQSNAITYGEVLHFEKAPKLSNISTSFSNVTFDVIVHNAEIASGSSGSALLNANLELIGINYATGTSGGVFVVGYTIPLSKIREYLKNNFNYL